MPWLRARALRQVIAREHRVKRGGFLHLVCDFRQPLHVDHILAIISHKPIQSALVPGHLPLAPKKDRVVAVQPISISTAIDSKELLDLFQASSNADLLQGRA